MAMAATEKLEKLEKLLNVDEAAALLDVPRSWIYARTRWGKDSDLPHTRIGGYVKFTRRDLEKFIKANTRGGKRVNARPGERPAPWRP